MQCMFLVVCRYYIPFWVISILIISMLVYITYTVNRRVSGNYISFTSSLKEYIVFSVSAIFTSFSSSRCGEVLEHMIPRLQREGQVHDAYNLCWNTICSSCWSVCVEPHRSNGTNRQGPYEFFRGSIWHCSFFPLQIGNGTCKIMSQHWNIFHVCMHACMYVQDKTGGWIHQYCRGEFRLLVPTSRHSSPPRSGEHYGH